jgi:hypothetical protein
MLAGNRALVLAVTWMIKKICTGHIILFRGGGGGEIKSLGIGWTMK